MHLNLQIVCIYICTHTHTLYVFILTYLCIYINAYGIHLYNVCICLYVYVGVNGYMQMLFMYISVGRSVISDSQQPQGLSPLSMEFSPCKARLSLKFSRQEYWSGYPLPFPRDLSNPGTETGSPALQADSLPSEPT